MKKIIMLFVLAIVCVGVQAQSKNIKTMLFSKLGYDVQGKDTVYYVTLLQYHNSLSFVGRNSLVENMQKILNTNLKKGESFQITNPAKDVLSFRSKTAFWVNRTFPISKATAAKTLRALGIEAYTQHEKNARNDSIDEAYRFSY
nr:MAG TPA: hypothetical protein [Caudoviricetes sp.]